MLPTHVFVTLESEKNRSERELKKSSSLYYQSPLFLPRATQEFIVKSFPQYTREESVI